ncbi:MAG: biotin--[acetyl-CoA-carboxylase] ligase [Acidobacteriota bacterium]|nr:biotin--[acetyl-CoA-carboxylase] ligase [Acidobacteriota bacterium]
MIHRLVTTASTMIDAAQLAKQGAPHGTAVVAERQTAGIGRHGHSWHSEQSNGLYLSMVLRIPAATPTLTLALGLAVQEALEVHADLRWPNDVMINERKAAGIMVQSAEAGVLIAGIGINVNHAEFPAEIARIATSLRIETGREHDKEALLQRVLAEVPRYVQLGKPEILKRFEANSTYVRGRRVIVDEKLEGVTAGLDQDGFLLLQTDRGIETILAGGVRPV